MCSITRGSIFSRSMEISEEARGEDSILRNISETRKLWTDAATTKNTNMLQPAKKSYDHVSLEEIGTSSDSESESELHIPSVRNLKNAWEKDKESATPLKVQPIHCPVIKKKEPLQMRQRIHKEPVDQANVVRPGQAGHKEVPDYVVNLKAVQNQFINGSAPKFNRPITEPLPNKKASIPRVKSAPINQTKADVVRSTAGEREVAVMPKGGLAAVRSRWESQVQETSRGRTRSRRPDPINLKDEAKEVRFREKSQKRESRHARRTASAGRVNDSE